MHLRVSAISVACLALFGCQPETEGPDQCRDENYALSALLSEVSAEPSYSELDGTIRDLMRVRGLPGCSIGVVDENDIVYVKGYGNANISEALPFEATTPSAIGSVSKTLTALAMLKLVELGYAALDDTVNAHLGANTVPEWESVTIHHLLSHTGGFAGDPIFEPGARLEADFQTLYGTDLEHPGLFPAILVPAYADLTPFDPAQVGTPQYSNAGYTVLGAVIDSIVADHPDALGAVGYEDFTWRAMPQTGFTLCQNEYWREDDIPNLAMGYDGSGEEAPAHLDGQSSSGAPTGGPAGWQGPAGGWSVTINDLMRVLIGVNTRANMDPALWEAMMTPHATVLGAPYGYGVFLSGSGAQSSGGIRVPGEQEEPLVYFHGGSIEGYKAFYRAQPETGRAVAAMCNSSNTGTETIVSAVEDYFWGGGPPLTLP